MKLMVLNLREEVAEHVPGEDHMDNGEEVFVLHLSIALLYQSINTPDQFAVATYRNVC